MRNGKIKISVASLINSTVRTESNLEKICRYTEQASNDGSDLILFPELALCDDYTEGSFHYFDYAQDENGIWINKLRQKSKTLGIFVGVGFPYKSRVPGRIYSSYVLIAPDGQIKKLIYRQCMTGEDQLYFCKGQRIGAVFSETSIGKIGYAIGSEISDETYVNDLKSIKPKLIIAAAKDKLLDVSTLAKNTGSFVAFSAIGSGKICDPAGRVIAEHIGDTEFAITLAL